VSLFTWEVADKLRVQKCVSFAPLSYVFTFPFYTTISSHTGGTAMVQARETLLGPRHMWGAGAGEMDM
jgi:hypothetical protein